MFFLKYRLSESCSATLIVFAGASAPVCASQIGCVIKPGSIKPRRTFLWKYSNGLSRTLFEEVGNSEPNKFVISANIMGVVDFMGMYCAWVDAVARGEGCMGSY